MKFELTLLVRSEEDESFKINEIDKILADNLMHLCAQFNILLLSLAEKELDRAIESERKKGWINDDIPF